MRNELNVGAAYFMGSAPVASSFTPSTVSSKLPAVPSNAHWTHNHEPVAMAVDPPTSISDGFLSDMKFMNQFPNCSPNRSEALNGFVPWTTKMLVWSGMTGLPKFRYTRP